MTTTTARHIDQVQVSYRLAGRTREREFRAASRTSTLAGTGRLVHFGPEPMAAAEDFALRVMADGAQDILVVPFYLVRAVATCERWGHDFAVVSMPKDPVVKMCLRCTRHEREC